MQRFVMVGCLALSLVTLARAASPLEVTTPRDARQQQSFVALHGGDARETFQGQALGRQLWLNSFGSSVNGQGPDGQLSLWYSGNYVTGSSAGRPVNLTAFGGSVSGYGARGYVSLSVTGGFIMGRSGNLNVSVSVNGPWANGTFGNQVFSLSGFSNLNPVAVAALIGAL